MSMDLSQKIQNEREHAHRLLATNVSNWGWSTPAGKIRKQRRVQFLTALSLPANGKVLEVGCGTGTYTSDLAKKFTSLTAVDISDALLQRAAENTADNNIEFKVADIHATPFSDHTFDAVVGCSVLHHLDWTKALQEIFRILKPGGVIRFSEPNLINPQIFLQKRWKWLKKKLGDSPDEQAFSSRSIRKILRRLKYEQISVRPFEFLHPMTPSFLIPFAIRTEKFLELTPVRNIAGSLQIKARKPE
jgi:ubiquinone/menaquinone biosynthesis C-methylase UbiE